MFSDGCHNIYMDSWIKWVKWMIDSSIDLFIYGFLSQICLCISNLPVMYIISIYSKYSKIHTSFKRALVLLCWIAGLLGTPKRCDCFNKHNSVGAQLRQSTADMSGQRYGYGLNLFSRYFCWFKEVPFHLRVWAFWWERLRGEMSTVYTAKVWNEAFTGAEPPV